MREFNLELAKAGHPVQTQDGRKVRIICWDRKSDVYPIVALIERSSCGEDCVFYTKDGHWYNDGDTPKLDLFMATEKHEGWINLYKDAIGIYHGQTIYKTKEEAVESAEHENERVTTIKIEWEELI